MSKYAWHIIWEMYMLNLDHEHMAYKAIGRITLRNYVRVGMLGESWWGKRIGMRRFGKYVG